jgi:hypothetical protein
VDEPKKSYYAIIPADVRYDKTLKPNAKLLYGEITALCNERGYCWASNKYFSGLYQVEMPTISRWISQLANRGYIKITVDIAAGNTRKIKINSTRVLTKKSIGHDKKDKRNTTDNKQTKQERILSATYDLERVKSLNG